MSQQLPLPARQVTNARSDARLILDRLRIAVRSDGASPKSFALLLQKASDTRAWEAEFRSFRAYVFGDERDGGLGMNETAFLHIAELGGVGHLARQLLYGEVAKKEDRSGRPINDRTTVIKSSRHDDVEYTIARLKRDDPDLAKKVIAGDVSAHSAALAKGWRKPRIVVSTPDRVAASLFKHMSADDIAQLIVTLIGMSANQGDGTP